MMKYLIYFISFFIVFPMVATFIVYFFSSRFHQNKWRSIHQTVHLTTFFYIASTLILIQMLFEQYFIGYLLILIITVLAVIVIIQWKTKKKIVFSIALKQLWRACFLLFSFMYICLVVFGIYEQLFRL